MPFLGFIIKGQNSTTWVSFTDKARGEFLKRMIFNSSKAESKKERKLLLLPQITTDNSPRSDKNKPNSYRRRRYQYDSRWANISR